MLGVLLAAALAIEIPLLGAPLAPDVVQELNLLPGVDRIELEDDLLRLTVVPGRAVRYADILRTIKNHTAATELDVDRIPLGRQQVQRQAPCAETFRTRATAYRLPNVWR